MKKTSILLFFFTLAISSFAGGDYSFKHIDDAAGLSSSRIKSIVKDSYGFMWFATTNGLNRYDGSTIRQLSCYDYDLNLGNDNINALYEDENKNLWVGTDRGIYVYNQAKDKFSFVSTQDKQRTAYPDNWVQTITGDGKGNVWALLPDQGVFRFNKGKVSNYTIISNGNFKEKFVSNILIDRNGNVWVSAKGEGLYKFNKGKERFEQADKLLHGIDIVSMCEAPDGSLILSNNVGVIYRYNIKQKKLSRIAFSMSGKVYLNALMCFGNDIWVGTQTGLYILNDTETLVRENPINKQSLSANAVSCLYKDNNGGAWIGTIFGGVNYMAHNQFGFKVYGLGTNLSSRRIRGMAMADNGNIWIGTEDAGLNVLNTVTESISNVKNLSGNYNIILTLEHSGNNIYAGFFLGGMDMIDSSGKVSRFFSNYAGSDNSVYSYIKDRHGNEWIGLGYALYRRKAGNKEFEHVKDTGFDWIFSLFEARDGTIWIGTMGSGLWKYNPKTGKYKSYIYDERKPNGLRSNCISSIMQDSRGDIWLSTDRGGISKYNPSTDNFTSYGINEGLPDNTSYKILEDNKGYLWFGTNQGLVKYKPTNPVSIDVFTVKDGLPGNQFSYNSAVKSPSGEFYFGGIQGIIRFNPDLEKQQRTPSPIYFTQLSVLNKDVNVSTDDKVLTENIIFAKEISLPYNKATFTLNVASPHYGVVGSDKYEYRLLPANKDWLPIKAGQIAFTNLAPGTYTLQVKVTNNGKVQSKEIKIHISPPWYRSTLAYLIYVLIVIGVIYTWVKWYHRRKTKQLKEEQRLFKINNEKDLYRSKVNFFTEIAHEIRTPLALIDAPLEAIEEIGVGDSKVQKYLNITRQNTKRLMQLTEQILTFQKVDSNNLIPKPENVNVTELVKEMTSRFEPSITLKHKELICDIKDENIFAFTDREMLTKVISNLLNNALKYAFRTIIVELDADNETLKIRVVSDGEKISGKEKERIFKPFYQGKHYLDRVDGVGIGLSLSRKLTELLKGSLIIDDNNTDYDDGNAFVLTLPISKEEIKEAETEHENVVDEHETAAETAQEWSTSNSTVLLVEDDEALREFLMEQTNVSFSVVTARNGQEALDKLRDMHIDIVVTDIMMPIMNGFELCKQMKQDVNLSYIPVVFITAKNDAESRIKGLKYGAEAYIEKPFSIRYLKQLIHSILDNRHRFREAFANKPLFKVSNMSMNKGDEEFMNKVIKLIEDNITENDFNVESMTNNLYMSRSSLLRKIKVLFNLSPVELIRLVKLKKAAELIQQCKYRIGDICYMVGIESPSYFSKLFQKQFGITPKDFEKECQNGVKHTFTITNKQDNNQ